MFYLNLLPSKTLICLCLHLFHLRFHAVGFSPNIMGHLCWLLFYIIHLTTGDSSCLIRIFFDLCHILSHSFRGESMHSTHLLFLLSKYLCCLLAASTPRIFCLFKFCIYLIFHFISLAVGSHLIYDTVSDEFFLVSVNSSSRQCIFCRPSSCSSFIISSNMSTLSWQVLMELWSFDAL